MSFLERRRNKGGLLRWETTDNGKQACCHQINREWRHTKRASGCFPSVTDEDAAIGRDCKQYDSWYYSKVGGMGGQEFLKGWTIMSHNDLHLLQHFPDAGLWEKSYSSAAIAQDKDDE